MYAIIQDGGHQYRVEKGQRLRLQLKDAAEGSTLTFDRVRLVAGEGEPRVGSPWVEGARVEARVLRSEVKGRKIHVRTFRRRKGTHRHLGHRQRYTEVEIVEISA